MVRSVVPPQDPEDDPTARAAAVRERIGTDAVQHDLKKTRTEPADVVDAGSAVVMEAASIGKAERNEGRVDMRSPVRYSEGLADFSVQRHDLRTDRKATWGGR